MFNVRAAVKRAVMHTGLPETRHVREAIDVARHPGWPYCPPDEGDLLYSLAGAVSGQNALEIGFATGSTAAYILAGLGDGRLTSIDYDQNHYARQGEALVASMAMADRHTLIEENSVLALPALMRSGHRFGLVFIDGWKTFDHLWVDTFYAARLLARGGYLIFDDGRMQAVRKCISLLVRYYKFSRLDSYQYIGGPRLRLWHLLSTHSTLAPYVALQKLLDLRETEAGTRFDFWRRF
jgi:predicted O-methyltransferase YrrM